MHELFSNKKKQIFSRRSPNEINRRDRGSYVCADVLFIFLFCLRKKDKMRGLLSIVFLFRNESNLFNNTGARILYLSLDIKINLKKNAYLA